MTAPRETIHTVTVGRFTLAVHREGSEFVFTQSHDGTECAATHHDTLIDALAHLRTEAADAWDQFRHGLAKERDDMDPEEIRRVEQEIAAWSRAAHTANRLIQDAEMARC